MAILQRFWQLIRSNLNFFPQQTEDTEQLLEDTLVKVQRELISIRGAIAGAIASEKKNQRHYLQHQEQAQSWYNRVQLALSQQNEDLAQSALSRCRYNLEIAQNLLKQISQQQRVIENLKQDLTTAEIKINELKFKQDLFLARTTTAFTVKEIAQFNDELKEGNTGDVLAQIEEKVWHLETDNNLLAKKPLDDLELTFRAMEMENYENLLNNSEQNLMFSSGFSEIKVDIEAQLRQIRSELEKLE